MSKSTDFSPDWCYEIDCGLDAKVVVDRIVEVIEIVNTQSTISWPSLDEWKNILPTWFVKSFIILTQDEAGALLKATPKNHWHQLPWEIESWLDAVQSRGWEWHSYQTDHNKARIELILNDWPASLEAFEWIVKTSGGKVIEGDFIHA